ncbi:PREDICTED: uncharacterized protein LOC109170764 [Ipomoea nil]|uniref:uncharacterized protein LOC109170764 n=1 Tax=Ipomoea nil TaxID=35883 RepID=UPI000901E19C|nr:PREDICTED: uncharacterized protein LOC109170764 [Ipomoea nil]
MAALLVQRVWKKKGMVQTTILAMELLLLSTGFFSALFKLKQAIPAINPYCCLLEFALSVSRQLGMSYRVVFSSPLHILFITSIIVVLILVSSRFHLPKLARLEFEYYDVFVGNLMEEDSLFNVSTESWEGKTVAEDDAPRSEKESKETRTAASSSNINGITAKVIVFESDVQDDDGVVSLKDVHVDCFRTLSGTWRVAASTVDDEMPHLQKISKSYGIETAATGINLMDYLKFSDENERPEEDNLMFSDENQRGEAGEEEEEDTMEATWIAISQGRDCREKNNNNNNMKLKKSETWLGVARRAEAQSAASGRSDEESSLEATWKELRKSVTFNDAVSACRRGGLARDLMTTSDEMKKRFDDFINNFNNELRLQRQESEQRLLAAITRGGLPGL